jgi:hypothetical protein
MTVPISIKAGERVTATTAQLGTENVGGHELNLAQRLEDTKVGIIIRRLHRFRRFFFKRGCAKLMSRKQRRLVSTKPVGTLTEGPGTAKAAICRYAGSPGPRLPVVVLRPRHFQSPVSAGASGAKIMAASRLRSARFAYAARLY